LPLIKTERKDVLREYELNKMFEKLKDADQLIGTYSTKLHGKKITQKFYIDCRMTECLIALLWLFGKRIYEILQLKREDVWVDNGFLWVRFKIGKKRKKYGRKGGVTETYVKKITVKNPYVKYVINYVKTKKEGEPLFPGRSTRRVIKTKWKDAEGNVRKIYTYERNERGLMSPVTAWKIIKFLNPKAWLHLFRESLATRMAEKGANIFQLMHWFDWEKEQTAVKYVKRGTKLIEELSEREW